MKRFLSCLLAAGLALGVFAPAAAQDGSDDRQAAFDLVAAHKYIEALPLLEKLAAESPSDVTILEKLGGSLLMSASALPPGGDARRQRRIRARQVILKAKDLGSKDPFITTFGPSLPEDGLDVVFSKIPEANSAMNDGEAAFAVDDLATAVSSYQRAFAADPKLYEAPLFAGDAAQRADDLATAEEWYARAIAVDPLRETAYRYWGRALLEEEHGDEALDKFIAAVIAEPYTEASWVGLGMWTQTQGLSLAHPEVNVPPSAADPTEGRRTLQREAASLRAAAKASTDESLALVTQMDEAGVLEAYVLLGRADPGIRKDYPQYRSAHRAAIRRYLMDFVIQF